MGNGADPFLFCVISGIFHIKQYHLECGFVEIFEDRISELWCKRIIFFKPQNKMSIGAHISYFKLYQLQEKKNISLLNFSIFHIFV